MGNSCNISSKNVSYCSGLSSAAAFLERFFFRLLSTASFLKLHFNIPWSSQKVFPSDFLWSARKINFDMHTSISDVVVGTTHILQSVIYTVACIDFAKNVHTGPPTNALPPSPQLRTSIAAVRYRCIVMWLVLLANCNKLRLMAPTPTMTSYRKRKQKTDVPHINPNTIHNRTVS